jgi:hypothetical protein
MARQRNGLTLSSGVGAVTRLLRQVAVQAEPTQPMFFDVGPPFIGQAKTRSSRFFNS